MLPLAIEDIKTRLLLGQSQDGASSEPLKIGVLTMEESGQLKIIEAPKPEETEVALIGENSNNSLALSIFLVLSFHTGIKIFSKTLKSASK